MQGNNLICVPGMLGGYDWPFCYAVTEAFVEVEEKLFVVGHTDRKGFIVDLATLPLETLIDVAVVWLYHFGCPFPYHKLGEI